jgi:hypothetical protein
MGELKTDHRQDAKTPRKQSLLSFALLGVLAVNPFAFSLKGLP